MKTPSLFGLNAKPSLPLRVLLAVLPFIIAISAYMYASNARLAENSADKLLPSVSQMATAVDRAAFKENRRTGEYLLWKDTASSLKRLLIGVGLAACFGLFLGLNMGLFKSLSAALSPFITVVSMVPPLAILPILFIAFGVGEVGFSLLRNIDGLNEYHEVKEAYEPNFLGFLLIGAAIYVAVGFLSRFAMVGVATSSEVDDEQASSSS